LRIEFAALNANQISGSMGLQDSGTEHLTQPRDRDLKCLASCCRRGLALERVDNPLGGDDLISVQEKQANQHFLLVPAQPQRSTLAADIERTENPKIHGVPFPNEPPNPIQRCTPQHVLVSAQTDESSAAVTKL
jgi:hypothetical protein